MGWGKWYAAAKRALVTITLDFRFTGSRSLDYGFCHSDNCHANLNTYIFDLTYLYNPSFT